ncbi:MAG: methyltransferase domain-containing protein [Kineosporiaceae bacterium]
MTQYRCRVCAGPLEQFLDLGTQPLSDRFVEPGRIGGEFVYQLAVGACRDCTMVQLVQEVPREEMFGDEYPYVSSGSATMRAHFGRLAERFLRTELTGRDPFVVELGCNDGVFLRHIADAQVRHLGVEPSASVAREAAKLGVDVRVDFFDADLAQEILATSGPADVVYAANTLCHIPYVDSVLRGVRTLLSDTGVFVFEDPYFSEILDRASYDQIYDEHFYLFTATSIRNLARRSGLMLADVEPIGVHGGELRYTLVKEGARTPAPAVAETVEREHRTGVTDPARLRDFAEVVGRNSHDLRRLLERLREDGSRVLGYGATAKSATVLNYCGIGPDLIEAICDSTPAKQGRLTPGSHIPVWPSEEFRADYPDHAVLFAWNHAEEIMGKEAAFREAGGRWITYVPRVRVS